MVDSPRTEGKAILTDEQHMFAKYNTSKKELGSKFEFELV